MRRNKSFFISLAFVFITVILWGVNLSPSTMTIYGPRKFIRATGKPVVVTETFSAPSATAHYNLIVLNGEKGKNRVSSATVKINGIEILRESDFNQQVDRIQRTISLQTSNSISVELKSAPGSFITVSILSETTNHPPMADAGPDQTVYVGDLVYLDSSKSSDVDGDLLSYRWSFFSVPTGSSVPLLNPTSVKASFTVDKPGTYIVQLIVNDGMMDSLPDAVTISTANSKPVANAGPDQTVYVGDTVQLDGSKSSDVDGELLTFHWSFTSKPAGSTATLSNPLAVKPTFALDLHGTYVVQLIVNDGQVDSASATVTITTLNSKPVANAGADQSICVGDTVQLDGSKSTDVDGDPLTFRWSFTSTPIGSIATLSDPKAMTLTFMVDLPGTYVVQLIVNDGQVDSASATVTITALNSKPVANAGSDQTVYLRDTIQLDGSGSRDADNDPLTYQWSFTSRPAQSQAVISDPTAVSPTFVADLVGLFVAQLMVHDGKVASSPDTVSITVIPRMVTVPNVAGMTQTAAQSTIIAANLTVGAITTANSSTLLVGQVISQNPLAGTSVPEGLPVNLVISLGPVMVAVPNVVGMTQATAELAIISAKLAVGPITQMNSATIPAGIVISQSPAGGTYVPQSSSVSLVVSIGPVMVTVPNVVGMIQTSAVAAIKAVNLVVGTITTANSTTVPAGGVISQNPASGISVAQGSPVNLVISIGLNVVPQPEGSFGEKYQDLIPPDATVQSYDSKRFSLITGLVRNLAGSPIADVSVNLLNNPGYGTAKTDTQGRFSIPVEGGGILTITYKKAGLITTQRKVYVPWNDIAIAETIVMIPEDPASTTLTFDRNPNTVVTHQSSIVSDERGSRSSTVVFTGNNRAYSVDASGNVIQELTTITTKATEFTTPDSMPAKLPPTSAYTYCVELSVDGVQRVRFDKPVILWIDNFLGFAVGQRVPVGYYDRDKGVWVPSDNGVVVRLLDTNRDGIVDALDANGDGLPDDLNGDGSFRDEVMGLNDPRRYPPGSTFWRVQVTHFSPWDCNWPYGPPADAIAPNPKGIPDADQQKKKEDDCTKNTSSSIEERSRIFHEDIPIPGTDMTLHYTSSRVKGFQQVITVPASGETVPPSLKRIIVQVDVAGRSFEKILNPLPNQKAEFIWDGLDHLGRPVNGAASAHITIGFVYDAVYLSAGIFAQAFAQAGSEVTGIRARQEVISWKRSDININIMSETMGVIAEGWTLSNHHSISTMDTSTLLKGDGSKESKANINAGFISTFAGNGYEGYSGDGGPAAGAEINRPDALAMDAEGNLYIAEHYNARIRKVDKSGIITTVAGNGSWEYSGDGGPATQAGLSPFGVAVDSDGNLYIADFDNYRVRKVDTNGIITTVAGYGTEGYDGSGDGGPAINAQFGGPCAVAVDTAGNLYIVDVYDGRVRKVDTNGIITTMAGYGTYGYSGDGGPAIQAKLAFPMGVTVDPVGNLYIADYYNYRIRKVDTSGIITTVAGGGEPLDPEFLGDGGPATEAWLYQPIGVAVDAAGNLYIADWYHYRIRKVDTNGIITTVAGNGTYGYSGDGGPATQAQISQPSAVALDAAGDLYIADSWYNSVIRKVTHGLFAELTTVGDIIFTEENGMGYIFSSGGRHKMTIDLDTGRVLYTFGYDQTSNLVSISDRFGNQTIIQRNGNGIPTSITSPDGITTTLSIDSNNHLTRITYPDGNFYSFEDTPDGLMTAKIEPEGNRFDHIFDSTGRLTDVTDQEGGHWSYSRSMSANGDILTRVLSAEGNLSSYLDHTDSTGAYTSRITDPSGAETVYALSADGLTATKSLPCGMNLTFKYDVDSQYKFQFVKEMREKTASALEKVTLREKIYQDTNSDKIPDLITEKVTLNGKLTSLVTNILQSKRTMTSPVGRTTNIFYDPNSLLTTKLSIPGLYDTTFGYDTRGRLTSINTDIRQTTFAYDARGNLFSITDPESRTTTYFYDAVGRMRGILRPDNSSVVFTYDKNGNMTVLTNPSTINHGFSYNKVNLNSSYQTPLSGSYSYLYNRDRRLTQINFPSGRQIKNIYDKDRLIQTQTPEGNIDLTYVCGNKLNSITKAGEVITYGYDGSLVTSETLSGTLNQVLTYAYNSDFNIREFTYAGSTVNYTYDNDGLLTGSGAFTITRNAGNGLPEAVTGGALNLLVPSMAIGELEGQNFTVNSFPHISWNLTRDKAGRITSKTETD